MQMLKELGVYQTAKHKTMVIFLIKQEMRV